ncbi:Juvenile hormone epoxide hydrolase 1, partial [Armadillidium nasatum]
MVKSLENTNFTYGIDSKVLKDIINYWRKDYSWKLAERRLNKLPHFTTEIEGLEIHFLHVKPSLRDLPRNITVFPILMIHGWPGSFLEFEEVFNFLTSPREGSSVVFEVIIPSIPGHGFSEAPAKP